MNDLRPLRLLAILVVALLASCAKDDLVAPHDCDHGDDVQTKAFLNASDPAGRPLDIELGKGDPSMMLRDGGTGDDGGEGGGGISDDGDDEADGERNKKDQH